MPLTFTKTVHPIDFSVLSGHEFERLVFATLLRMYAWLSLDWYGQTGGDGGRDIVGLRDDDYGTIRSVVVACANWRNFSSTKGKSDIDNFVSTMKTLPNEVILIAGDAVSSAIKDTCAEYAKSKKIQHVQVWSGAELEEHIRFHATSVLSRFFNGVELPDEPAQLKQFVHLLDPETEREAGEMVARLFKRPAFSTPIETESYLPAFRTAISDTISALNTGIWRDRENAIIARIPSRYAFPDPVVQNALELCVEALNSLRITFDDGLRTGTIKRCGCGKPDCTMFEIKPNCRQQLERERCEVLRYANSALQYLGVKPVAPPHERRGS